MGKVLALKGHKSKYRTLKVKELDYISHKALSQVRTTITAVGIALREVQDKMAHLKSQVVPNKPTNISNCLYYTRESSWDGIVGRTG